MEKFKYAPGLPGYGTRGVDGSAGLSGLATYFSSYDGLTDTTVIRSRLQNNKNLLADGAYLSGYPDRLYQVGDIFIDKNGKVFKITIIGASANYGDPVGQLNTSGLFIVNDTYGANTRYSNDYVTQKYLIDDVLTAGSVSNYTLYPSEIYGFTPNEFMKIKYSDYSEGGNDYTPFEVYTSGVGDNESIAIVRDYINNIFRIGNLDSSGNVRNTHIIFDASTVKVSKDTGATYNHDTESGSLVTNYEMAANYLFTPNFTSNPDSFTYDSVSTDASIVWDLTDFVNTQSLEVLNSIKADLYFYLKDTVYNNQVISFSGGNDVSTYKPFILHNIDSSGSVNFTGLTDGTNYETYIRFSSNGWVRDSERMQVRTGGIEYLTITPTSFSSISAAGDTRDASIDSSFVWGGTDGSIYTDYPTWISWVPDGSANGYSNLHITIGANVSGARTGHVYIPSDRAGLKTITLNQLSGLTATLLVDVGGSPSTYAYQYWGADGQVCELLNSATVNVTASVGNDWSATSSQPSWCTIADDEGTGDGTFTISCTLNGSSSSNRIATVTVHSDAGDRYIYVEQYCSDEETCEGCPE